MDPTIILGASKGSCVNIYWVFALFRLLKLRSSVRSCDNPQAKDVSWHTGHTNIVPSIKQESPTTLQVNTKERKKLTKLYVNHNKEHYLFAAFRSAKYTTKTFWYEFLMTAKILPGFAGNIVSRWHLLLPTIADASRGYGNKEREGVGLCRSEKSEEMRRGLFSLWSTTNEGGAPETHWLEIHNSFVIPPPFLWSTSGSRPIPVCLLTMHACSLGS